jgi:hypothetical protein
MHKRHSLGLICLMVAGLAVGFAGVADAQGAASDDLKAIWSSLTPEEQAAYEKAGRERAAALPRPAVLVPGDTCAAATLEISTLPFNDANTTVGLTDDFTYGAECGGFNGSSGIGPDIAYVVQTDVTCDVTVAMDPTANDLALWVVTDCADPVGGCVGGDDSGGGGTAELVSFSATAGTDHFIVVDGFGGASDTFTLQIVEDTATGCALVPVELQQFQVQ